MKTTNKDGKTNYIFVILASFLIFPSDVLAKRDGTIPTVSYGIRFLHTLILALPINIIGYSIFWVFASKFFSSKPYRVLKYIFASTMLCSSVTALDDLNDESWNPGQGVLVFFAFSISFTIFRILANKNIFFAFGAALVFLLISLIPMYFGGMILQAMITDLGIRIEW